MSTDEVQSLRRDFNDLRAEVHAWGGKIDVMHAAVQSLAGRVYVPGPSVWKRLASFLGLMRLG